MGDCAVQALVIAPLVHHVVNSNISIFLYSYIIYYRGGGHRLISGMGLKVLVCPLCLRNRAIIIIGMNKVCELSEMKKTDRHLTESIFEQISRVGKAVGNPKRLEILDLLSQAPRTVDCLTQTVGISQPGISQHLRTLRQANLIVAERDGAFIRYRIADDIVADFYCTLRTLAVANLPELERITRDYFSPDEPIEPVDRKALRRRGRNGEVTIIDVRPHEEYLNAHIRDAISIPIDELEDRLAELPVDQEIVAYCRGPYCVWSGQAVALLRENNFTATHLRDGVLDWKSHGMPIAQSI